MPCLQNDDRIILHEFFNYEMHETHEKSLLVSASK